jgi:hypothetical protein
MQHIRLRCAPKTSFWSITNEQRRLCRSRIAALTLAGFDCHLRSELPAYEANGFPVSPLQVRVLGAAQVRAAGLDARRRRDGASGQRSVRRAK